jgi:hypothetical protein
MNRQPHLVDADKIAPKLADQLALLESKYPYDLWLVRTTPTTSRRYEIRRLGEGLERQMALARVPHDRRPVESVQRD